MLQADVVIGLLSDPDSFLKGELSLLATVKGNTEVAKNLFMQTHPTMRCYRQGGGKTQGSGRSRAWNRQGPKRSYPIVDSPPRPVDFRVSTK